MLVELFLEQTVVGTIIPEITNKLQMYINVLKEPCLV